MRKWARDSERHGIQIGFYNRRGRSRIEAEWGGGLPNTLRLTDDFGVRIIDAPGGVGDGPRRIDRPVL
jgi:hypothetical protein